MKQMIARLTMVAAVTLTLPACTSIFGSRLFARQDRSHAAPVQSMATASTEAGRKHLDAGRTGLAIEAFQMAVVMGEPPAPAFNGLGVSYARLGRYDLAERYFGKALAYDPQNQGYQANLARLMRSPAFALRREGDRGAEFLAEVRQEAKQAEVAVAPVPGRLQRAGAGQVFIQTIAPMTAPSRMATASRRVERPVAAQPDAGDESVTAAPKPRPRVVSLRMPVRAPAAAIAN